MEWLNENAGILIIVFAVALIALTVTIIVMLNRMLRNIAVQRLNFLGFYSADVQTRAKYAELTIGNKSLNDVGLSELGIRNGKVNFSLTALYKQKKGIAPETRVVVEQRSSVSFTLSAEELRVVLTDGKDGKKQLKTLRLYAVDLTGNLYQGRIGNVRKLLAELLAEDKALEKGTERTALPAFLSLGRKHAEEEKAEEPAPVSAAEERAESAESCEKATEACAKEAAECADSAEEAAEAAEAAEKAAEVSAKEAEESSKEAEKAAEDAENAAREAESKAENAE